MRCRSQNQKNHCDRISINAKRDCILNSKADAHIIKPVDIEKLLATIRGQLQLQEDERKVSEQKVTEFVKTRAKKLLTEHG
jgi:DNA-binding response OmpR family regulator